MSRHEARVDFALAWLVRPLLWSWFKLFHRLQVRGRRYLPRSGPAVVAPNHQSHYDGPLAGFLVPCPCYWMINGSYCRMPLLGWFLRTFRGIPVDGPEDLGAYRQVLRRLSAGQVVGVFPEGHRSRDGELLELQTGAARAALTVGADIVPVSIVGSFDAWPRQRWFPSLFRPIVVEYHRPIRCEKAERRHLKRRVDEVTGELAGVLHRRLEAWRRLRNRLSRPGRARDF